MTFSTWASLRCVLELATIWHPQNRTQGHCVVQMWKCFQVLFWILLIVYSSHYQCPDWGTLTFNNESWRAAQDNKALRAALVTLCRARLGGNCGLYSGGGGGECRESVNPAPHRLGHTFTHSEVSRGQTRQFLVIWYLPLFFPIFNYLCSLLFIIRFYFNLKMQLLNS